MVNKLLNKLIGRNIRWKSVPVRNEDFPAQRLRKPITLNKYMPREFWRVENVLVSCYHINEKKNLIEPITKESYDDSSDLSHGVYTTKIF